MSRIQFYVDTQSRYQVQKLVNQLKLRNFLCDRRRVTSQASTTRCEIDVNSRFSKTNWKFELFVTERYLFRKHSYVVRNKILFANKPSKIPWDFSECKAASLWYSGNVIVVFILKNKYLSNKTKNKNSSSFVSEKIIIFWWNDVMSKQICIIHCSRMSKNEKNGKFIC